MRVWKGFVGLAVLMLACSGAAALGDDTNSNSMGTGNDQVPPADQVEAPPADETPAAAAAPTKTTTYGPFMQALEQLGIGKPMENLGFNIHGYVEGGYL